MLSKAGTATGEGARIERAEPGEVRVRRALLSVSDKRGVVDFARGLEELGVEVISTGGTAREREEVLRALRPLEHGLLTEAVRLYARGALRADPANPRRTIIDVPAQRGGDG